MFKLITYHQIVFLNRFLSIKKNVLTFIIKFLLKFYYHYELIISIFPKRFIIFINFEKNV